MNLPPATFESLVGFFWVGFITLIAIVNPLAAIPALVAPTNNGNCNYPRIAKRASVVCLLVLWASAAIGPSLLQVMGITLSAFRVAGGIFIFLIAIDMIKDRPSSLELGGDISIMPLAVPLLAGPGAISTVMAMRTKATNIGETVMVFAIVVGVVIITYFVLVCAAYLIKRIKAYLSITTKIMGLLLIAIAIQLILEGLTPEFTSILAKSGY